MLLMGMYFLFNRLSDCLNLIERIPRSLLRGHSLKDGFKNKEQGFTINEVGINLPDWDTS
jgi:hypothetical protein